MNAPAPAIDPAQRRYARWLAWGTAVSLGLLVVAFLLYVSGTFGAHVPIDSLPRLWKLSSGELLRETGLAPGWGWFALAHRGDMLNMAGIALLATCSLPCLAAVIPVFRSRGERALAFICSLQIAVILLAASGVLSVGH